MGSLKCCCAVLSFPQLLRAPLDPLLQPQTFPDGFQCSSVSSQVAPVCNRLNSSSPVGKYGT